MDTAKLDLETIFSAALARQSPAQRAAWLDQACAGDDELRRNVERLLSAYPEIGGFLESSPAGVLAASVEPICESPGTVIGPYKLLEQIGEGGFGVVYLAEQQRPVKRRVALKVIKPGMDTRAVIARFEAERQALALMDHPNIAKVFDAGRVGSVCGSTELAEVRTGPEVLSNDADQGPTRQVGPTGRPYFVMELVHGIPITEYCDLCNLSMRERLELFACVCQAVQHAHQKGVIHRDLKPTNVLVAMQDGRAAPKIIDFGVAKAINQRLTEHTLATGFSQMIGTPLYMSPEQAELSRLGVDTRSDIYSLGVLLYELLTGTTPFEKERLRAAPFDELRRILREEEPQRPSSRLTTLAADLASTVAGHRRTEPRRLRQYVRGELDWIVMKCLEKDRNRRYETASGLALDVLHYLRDEPVTACPPSVAYRVRAFARRNRATFVTAGVVAVALLAGTALSAWQAVRAIQAERLAEDRLQAEYAAHQQAEDARAAAEGSFQKARQAVDDMYTQVAEKWLARQPQMERVQRGFLEKALQFYTEAAQRTGTDPGIRLETARAHRRMADIQHRLGEPRPAEEAFRQAEKRLQALVDEFPAEPNYRSELADTLHQLGVLLGDTGRYSEEERAHRRALAIGQELATAFPLVAEYRRDVGRGHWFVARVLSYLHRREEAVQAYRAALAIQIPLAAEFPSVPDYRDHLAQSQLGLGRELRHLDRAAERQQVLSEAAVILERLSAEFPSVPGYRNQLADVYYWLMRGPGGLPATYPKEAEEYLRKALSLQQELADDFPGVADYRYDLFRSRHTLGQLMSRSDRPEEAEAALRAASAVAAKLVADAPTVHYYRGGLAYVKASLGELLEKTGRLNEAETSYREAIGLLNALVAEFPDVPGYRRHLTQAYVSLASVLTTAGRTEEAAEAHREALRLSAKDAAAFDDVVDPLDIKADELSQKLKVQKDEIDR